MIKHLSLLILISFVLVGCHNDKQITEKYLSGNWECQYSDYTMTLFNLDGSIASTSNEIYNQTPKFSYSIDDGVFYTNLERKRVASSLEKLRHDKYKQPNGAESELYAEFSYISENEFEKTNQLTILVNDNDIANATINSKMRCKRVE